MPEHPEKPEQQDQQQQHRRHRQGLKPFSPKECHRPTLIQVIAPSACSHKDSVPDYLVENPARSLSQLG